jgi:hypothetical protein
MAILPPKPPPISVGTTLIFEIGWPSIREVCRAMNEPCVAVQIVTWPSEFHMAVATCGSM